MTRSSSPEVGYAVQEQHRVVFVQAIALMAHYPSPTDDFDHRNGQSPLVVTIATPAGPPPPPPSLGPLGGPGPASVQWNGERRSRAVGSEAPLDRRADIAYPPQREPS